MERANRKPILLLLLFADRATSDDAERAGDSAELYAGTAFELLDNPRRRHLLAYLAECGGSAPLTDAVDHVAARENDCDPEEVFSTDRKTVYDSLRRRHVPRLSGVGVVVHDERRGVVSLGPSAGAVIDRLGDCRPPCARWETYYLGLSATVGAFVAAEVAATVPELLFGGEHAVAAGLFCALTLVAALDARYRFSAR